MGTVRLLSTYVPPFPRPLYGNATVEIQMVFSRTYQGNAWWTFCAVVSIVLLVRVALEFRRKHRAGEAVRSGDVIRTSVVFLMFLGIAIYQILTHQ